MVDAVDPKTGRTMKVKASMAVSVTGPEVAASDAQITATTLMNLSTALKQLVEAGVMTPAAAQVAARKGWEDYVGVPFTAELATPDANPDDVAQAVDDAGKSPAGGGGARPKAPAAPGSPSSAAEAGWDPSQLRDPDGRWGSGGPVGSIVANLRTEIASHAHRGKISPETKSMSALPAGTRKAILDQVSDEGTDPEHLDAAVANTDTWLARGGIANLRPNVEDELPAKIVKARVAAFNARAEQIEQPTAASHRLATAIQGEVTSEIVAGRLPWDTRRLSPSDEAELATVGRDVVGMTSGDYDAQKLKRPVDLAAMAEVRDWLASRPIGPEPEADDRSRAVAHGAKKAIVHAVNGGQLDTGSHIRGNRRRELPATWDALPEPLQRQVIAAGHGHTAGGGRPLQLADRPAVVEVDAWLRAGMPATAGVPAVDPTLPADDLERAVRSGQVSVATLPRAVRDQLPDDLR
jgi:hypothetical protein